MYFKVVASQLSVCRDDYVIGAIYKGLDNVWTFFVYDSKIPERRGLSDTDVRDIYRMLELLKS